MSSMFLHIGSQLVRSYYLAKTSVTEMEHPNILVRTRACRFTSITLFVDLSSPLKEEELANAEVLKENVFKPFKTGHDSSSKTN